MLLGADSSYDPKNYLGFGDWDIAPSKLIDTALMETASDDWFVDFNNDGLPELAVGRLPARSLGEATAMVAKIIDYEHSPSSEEILLVADVSDTYRLRASECFSEEFDTAESASKSDRPGKQRSGNRTESTAGCDQSRAEGCQLRRPRLSDIVEG